MIFGNPVDGPRIVPFGEARLPTDKLPNGHLGFRVTQRFADVNLTYSPKPHGALDVGNYVCGDRVIATAPGTARRFGPDANGALAVIVSHVDGWVTEYWHLAAFTITNGQSVVPGQQIGVVGDTGLGAVCHLHFVVKRNGVLTDPWPLLIQNGAQEDDMVPIPTAAYTELVNKKTSTSGWANFRADRLLSAAIHKLYPAGTAFRPSVSANDGSAAGGATPTLWYGGFLYDDSPAGFVFGWFHSSVVGPLEEDVADCAAQVKAATDPLKVEVASFKADLATVKAQLAAANSKISAAKNALD